MERVYLLREREFLKTNENIYKIGRTTQINDNRIKQYPKGSELILLVTVDNCIFIENKIKILFKQKYTQRKDIGTEYFEGNYINMRNNIFDIITKYETNCHEIIPSDEMIEKKRKYVEDNSRDYLTDFIQSKIVRNVEAAQKRGEWCIKKDEFVREYHYWCADMKYHIEKLSPTAFTKRMTKNGISNKESHSIVWFENIQFRKEGNEDIENNMISVESL